MTTGRLKKLIEFIPDDFEVEVEVEVETPDAIEREKCQIKKGSYDICYSEKVMKLIVRIVELAK